MHTQMVGLYRDPHGKKIFSKSAAAQHATAGTDKNRLSKDQTIESLQVRVKELELALSKYDNPQTQNFEAVSKKTSKVSFTQDENGEIVIIC